MADDQKAPTPSDADLLAKAIPIEDLETADESQPIELPEEPATGAAGAESATIELDEGPEEVHHEIRAFGGHDTAHIDQKWRRKVNTTGTGAVHCRTFVAKLRLDALDHLDEQINEWLDAHPEFEVKHVTATVGVLTGKLREEALFLNVWV